MQLAKFLYYVLNYNNNVIWKNNICFEQFYDYNQYTLSNR